MWYSTFVMLRGCYKLSDLDLLTSCSSNEDFLLVQVILSESYSLEIKNQMNVFCIADIVLGNIVLW